MRRHRLPGAAALAIALAIALAACGSGSAGSAAPSGSGGAPSVIPQIVSSQQVVGANRFVFSFLDPKTNTPVATPDRTAAVAFVSPGEKQPGTAVAGTFTWGITGSVGVYVSNVTFPVAGDWTAVFITQAPDKPSEAIGVAFQVLDKGTTVGIGQKAPRSVTPTAADVNGDLGKISTDPTPAAVFYQLSVAQAEQQGRPFVLVFATPRFCQSRQCGPTLDVVKSIAGTSPANVAFIHVEPYKMTFTDGTLQPVLDANNQLQPTDVISQWGVVSEPWVFTVDAKGIIRGSFEGVVGNDELKTAIAVIAGS